MSRGKDAALCGIKGLHSGHKKLFLFKAPSFRVLFKYTVNSNFVVKFVPQFKLAGSSISTYLLRVRLYLTAAAPCLLNVNQQTASKVVEEQYLAHI